MKRIKALVITLLAASLLINSAVATAHVIHSRIGRAVMGMAWGLVIFWIVIGGSLMYAYRDSIRERVLKIPLDWRLKFFLFGTLLALLEEVVTTTMTNLAPLFGVKVGEAYITASTNYFDVVFLHSVVAFFPWIIAWALLLAFIDFSPFAVFLLFGSLGMLGEVVFGGVQNFLAFGFWIFVYGLMIYLPAYSIPRERKTVSPKWWHYAVSMIVPWLFSMPWDLLVMFVLKGHPKVHFPPIKMG
jgi:hypothetical protein